MSGNPEVAQTNQLQGGVPLKKCQYVCCLVLLRQVRYAFKANYVDTQEQ